MLYHSNMEEFGKIIVFRVLAKTNKSIMNKFCRQFYGYLDRSHNSQYTYKRKGFIERFPYIKPLRGVIIVKKEDAKKIISFLNSYNAEIYARDIILVKEDKDKLKSVKK
jgi:hypothetical protein